MLLRTTRFGDLDIDEDRLLTFDEGPMGFPAARTFALVDVAENEDFFWLQSTDDADLAFLGTVPWAYFPDYEPEISEEVVSRLELGSEDEPTVLCLLTIDRERREVTANLLGPVVVNPRTRRGCQTVLYDQDWPTAAPLGPGVV